jgi:segregation and condensation protein B
MALEQTAQRMPEATPTEDRQKHNLALLEAALYVAGRPLDLRTLCSVMHTRSVAKVKNLAKLLSDEYKARGTALEVLELADEKYVLQLKAEYTPYVRKLSIRPLLSAGPLKTLAYIAFRQPVSQAHMIAVRGSHAYGHVKQLEEMGLITRERVRRSSLIKTTEFFADYFGFSHDTRLMKRQLKDVFKDSEEKEPEATE